MENHIEIENQNQQSKPVLNSLRLISLNQQIPFCCVISESTILYIGGRSLIIQNIRTQQQSILWVGSSCYEIAGVAKSLVSYAPIRVAFVLRNNQQKIYEIAVLSIDWNNYFYKKKHQRYIKLHQLLVMQGQTPPMIQFDASGQKLLLNTYQKNYNYLTIYSSITGKQQLKRTIQHPVLFMKPFINKNQSCLALVFEHQISIITNNGQIIEETTKLHEQGLAKQQKILQIEFNQNHSNKLFGFVLTNLGNMIFFQLEENNIEGIFKIDIKADSNMKIKCQPQNNQKTKKITTIKLIGHDQQNDNIIRKPTSFMIHGNRIIIGYENSRKLIYITFSLVNYTCFSVVCTENQIFFPYQDADDEHIKNKKIKISMISLSTDLCTGGLVVSDQQGATYIIILDILNSLIADQRRTNTSNRIFGNYSCKGTCNSVAYSQKQSSLFVLHENSRGNSYLAYYLISYFQISKQTPNQTQMWDQQLKLKAQKIAVHPCNYSILIIYDQVVKLHYYSRQKLFESHVSIHLSNCQVGAFSPLGERIVLGNMGGLFIINSYTYQVYNIVNPVGLINKVPKQLQFTSVFDMVIQYYSGNTSYLAQIVNYRVKFLGQLQTAHQQTVVNNIPTYQPFKQSVLLQQRSYNKTIQIDSKRRIIILVIPGVHVRFYNFQLQILNLLSIQTQCIHLCKEIEILFVGTSKGSLLMLKWPDIVDKVSNVRAHDPQIIAMHNVHKDKIVSISLSENYRFIFIVSQSGELSVLQFLQQNSSNISRSGALIMLKKSNNKPILNDCLTSISDQNKRAQAIIKAVGKQVQVNKRNHKICQQLMANLQQKIKQQKIKTQIVIKDQIQLSQQQKKIKSIVRKIDNVKTELLNIDRIKQSQMTKQKMEFDANLRRLFKQKTQYQNKMNGIYQQHRNELQALKQTLKLQYQNQVYAQSTQIQLLQKGTHTNQLINRKLWQYNKAQLFKEQQNKLQSLQMINYEFKQQLKQLNSKKNQLQISIRRYTFAVSELATKNNQFSLQIMQLENDLKMIGKSRPERIINQAQVQNKLKQVKIKNQQLIIQHRVFEQEKQNIEKKAKVVESLHQKLQQDLKKLQNADDQICNKKLELDDQFYQQNRRKILLTQAIKQMKSKIIQLRQTRNRVKQQSVLKSKKLSRSLCRSGIKQGEKQVSKEHSGKQQESQPKTQTIQQNLNRNTLKVNKSNSNSVLDQDQFSLFKNTSTSANATNTTNTFRSNSNKLNNSLTNMSDMNKKLYKISKNKFNNLTAQKSDEVAQDIEQDQFDNVIQKRDQGCQKLDKLNRIKNDKIRQYKQINQKLINDHKRLISQLNQLKRYNDFLIKKQMKLKLQIQHGSLNIRQNKSIYNKIQTQEETHSNTKVKTVSNSLHKENDKSGNRTAVPKTRLLKSGFVSLYKNGKISINNQKLITDHDE